MRSVRIDDPHQIARIGIVELKPRALIQHIRVDPVGPQQRDPLFAFGALAGRKNESSSFDLPLRQVTARQRLTRWKQSLGTLAGWSYPIRLTVCLALGFTGDHFWPDHHLHWIGPTVALLTSRQAEAIPIKVTDPNPRTRSNLGPPGCS